jgi:hypothetical protein
MAFDEYVYDKDHARRLDLLETARGLEFVVEQDSTRDVTIVLDDRGVRQLRLALTRYENHRKDRH